MKDQNSLQFDRRSVLKGVASLGGATVLAAMPAPCLPLEAPSKSRSSEGTVVASDSNAIVETTGGKVRGFTRHEIHTFRGIPYAASPEGSLRFLPPVKAAPWSGVRSSMYYGPVAPQGPRNDWANDEIAFMYHFDDGQQGEDCLRLNLWTPGLNDHGRRPVMVWLHGGGFTGGNSHEQPGYDGENLSRRGDVVVVSAGHRLGALGYLNLAAYGEKYSSAANAGMLDLIAALEWVRDNISAFGGDPGNVTIFGQSGGGGKVSTLMAMPAAKGLFHRACVMSGSTLRVNTAESSAKLADALLAELGISSAQIDELQQVPYHRVIEAGSAAVRKLSPPVKASTGGPPVVKWADRDKPRYDWGPVVDGKDLPAHPFDPVAPAISADVPMLIGSCFHEFCLSAYHDELESMSEEEMRQRVREIHGDNAVKIIAAYRTEHPDVKPVELLAFISFPRANVVAQATRKAALNAAPAFVYWFGWKTPILDGRPRAFHCSDIAFAFDNTDVADTLTGGGADARTLAAKVSDAFIHFAHSGNPNNGGLPRWPAFTAVNGETMIFDNQCEVRNDPDREGRKALEG